MKARNEIVLAFLPVESKINILSVNIYLNGNLFFGFRRCCGKVFPKPAVSHARTLFCTIVFLQTLYKISKETGKLFWCWCSGNMTTYDK